MLFIITKCLSPSNSGIFKSIIFCKTILGVVFRNVNSSEGSLPFKANKNEFSEHKCLVNLWKSFKDEKALEIITSNLSLL